jgi:ubiquinone/menaquinone biosynthesis methyltransferase
MKFRSLLENIGAVKLKRMGLNLMQNEVVLNANQLLEEKESVPNTFNKIARRYDFATLLSQGYSRDLERSVRLMNLHGNESILDLCCGTGKSTKYCLEAVPKGNVLAIDNSSGMLSVASENFKKEIEEKRCRFLEQDVMRLDLPNNSVDGIFMAYGIRNMPDYEKCLKNLLRILKPGGIIAFHEFSLTEGSFSRLYWKILGYTLIIPFSALITGNLTIFTYLIKSVLNFPTPKVFTELLSKTGFDQVKNHPQKSWRKYILHTFIAKKPSIQNI